MQERVVSDCLRRQIPIPPPYDNPPEVGPEFGLYVWAFNSLTAERDPITATKDAVSVPRITYKAIREWAEFHGYAGDTDFMREFVILIREMDSVWVEAETKRLKREISRGRT